jgi:hypothetical protein
MTRYAGALAALLAAACACAPDAAPPVAEPPVARPWIELLDPADLAAARLGAWVETPFGGPGAVRVEPDRLVLEPGAPLTGVTWEGALPVAPYELEVEAARLAGTDFFCGLTFPVAGAHLTLVLGGWGGALVGLSCLDGADASANETRSYRDFPAGRPVRARLAVTAERVRVRLDGELVIDAPVAGRRLELRPEVLRSRPLGIAAYATTAALRRVRWRPLVPGAGPGTHP